MKSAVKFFETTYYRLVTTYTFEVREPVSSSCSKRVTQFVGRFSFNIAIDTVNLCGEGRILDSV